MKAEPKAPANTRMMTIVHEALRRDLRRAWQALENTAPPPDDQRRAIARHLTWMMQFLHHHHAGEDVGLYPLVRERNPGAANLLDAMNADHEAVAPAITDVETAAAAYGHNGSDGERERLLVALANLDQTLLPHLQREEDEMMPVVSSTLTNAEWQAVDHEYFVDPKSFSELGREGHWLIDDVSPADRATVLSEVPPIPRFVLLHGFARSYRRQKVACWGDSNPSEKRLQTSGRSEVWVDADPPAVWDVVSDVTRTGEWSHECVKVDWLGGATSAVPGARFRGRNRSGVFRWGRVCEVISAEPWLLVWRTVPTALFPDSSEWAIELHEDAGGTRIEQTFRALKVPKILARVYAMVIPAHRDRTDALTDDLRRLGALAMGAHAHTPT